jgi:hypothetical protein
MLKISKVDLLATEDGDFKAGDIISVRVGIIPNTRWITGRLINAGSHSSLTLDCSNKFDSREISIEFKDIWNIKRGEHLDPS